VFVYALRLRTQVDASLLRRRLFSIVFINSLNRARMQVKENTKEHWERSGNDGYTDMILQLFSSPEWRAHG
jgi:uncharacterized Ntn-hydrolase superfamily protein